MTNVIKNPAGDAIRRSPVHDALEHVHPEWALLHGMPAALNIRDGGNTSSTPAGLCDVSAIPRMAVKGPGAAEWLKEQGFVVPGSIYECAAIGTAGFVARTGSAEFFLEESVGHDFIAKLLAAPVAAKRGVYRMQRQDASFLLSGEKAVCVLSETCGVDFSKPDAKLVYSRVAGVSCAILHRTLNGVSVWQLWCDNSYGMYFWETLLEIVKDHGGAAAVMSLFYAIAPAAVVVRQS